MVGECKEEARDVVVVCAVRRAAARPLIPVEGRAPPFTEVRWECREWSESQDQSERG